MRLWIFDFDGTISTKAADRTTTALDPGCDTLLRRLAHISSDRVIVISNRNVFDIAERINIPGVIVGGCNGIEWQLPSGYRVGYFRDYEDDLITSRINVLPEIRKIVSDPEIEIDDKLWSIAVHAGKTTARTWNDVVNKVNAWSTRHGLTAYFGGRQIDIQLVPGFNKSIGISFLARMFDINPDQDSVVYVGDDESDVTALWWTMLFGGAAIIVGRSISVPGAFHVKKTSSLVSELDKLVPVR